MKNGRAGWLNILTIIGSVMFAVQTEAAVPYVNYHHTVTQPDGSTLELILNGSTLYADQRTKDGYPVIYDNTLKGYAYAKLSENEEMFESTGILVTESNGIREGANKRGNSSRLTQSFHFFMFEPIFSPVNALNQPI